MPYIRKVYNGKPFNPVHKFSIMIRKYGRSPFKVALIHGGPGSPGGLLELAQDLSKSRGILEPIQSADSVMGQVDELNMQLEGNIPIILVGHSWGAMLAFIFAAIYPSRVSKLILVSSGVFEEKYSENIMKTRLKRLEKKDAVKVSELIESLKTSNDKDATFEMLGGLLSAADSRDAIKSKNELNPQYAVYKKVWDELKTLRISRKLTQLGSKITCPVVAFHGDYDPHPAEGVREPLERVLKHFRFVLLEDCGHYPWLEKAVKDEFYARLEAELNRS